MIHANDETRDGKLVKRSMRIAGHRTSLALEREFWLALEGIALTQKRSLPGLIAAIDQNRARDKPQSSLAAAARLYALEHTSLPLELQS